MSIMGMFWAILVDMLLFFITLVVFMVPCAFLYAAYKVWSKPDYVARLAMLVGDTKTVLRGTSHFSDPFLQKTGVAYDVRNDRWIPQSSLNRRALEGFFD